MRLDSACARALGFDLIDVCRLDRVPVLVLDHWSVPAPPADVRFLPLKARCESQRT